MELPSFVLVAKRSARGEPIRKRHFSVSVYNRRRSRGKPDLLRDGGRAHHDRIPGRYRPWAAEAIRASFSGRRRLPESAQ